MKYTVFRIISLDSSCHLGWISFIAMHFCPFVEGCVLFPYNLSRMRLRRQWEQPSCPERTCDWDSSLVLRTELYSDWWSGWTVTSICVAQVTTAFLSQWWIFQNDCLVVHKHTYYRFTEWFLYTDTSADFYFLLLVLLILVTN